MNDLTIGEALDKITLIKAKIKKNFEYITKYSSILSFEKPQFESEESQKKEVLKYVQSNLDLIEEYLKLKTAIELTNMKTIVEIDGKKFSISDIIRLQREVGSWYLSTYNSMDDKSAQSRLRSSNSVDGRPPTITRLYSEELKNRNLEKWMELLGKLESRKKVINATTKLIMQ